MVARTTNGLVFKFTSSEGKVVNTSLISLRLLDFDNVNTHLQYYFTTRQGHRNFILPPDTLLK